MVAVVSPLAHGSQGSSESECNPYPKTDGSDIHASGSIELSGLGKLAGGGVRGNFSKKDKRLLADGPDTNWAEVMMALFAYHCQSVKGLSPVERAKADQRFEAGAWKALSESESRTKPDNTRALNASVALQAKKNNSAIAPSTRQAASLLKIAARQYKSAMGMPFMAALGGSYVPVVPYELLTNKAMLSMVANQNLMEPVPKTNTVPKEDTESLAYGMCRGVQDGDKQVNETMVRYGSKIPERLYADIGAVQDTIIYKYFNGFIVSGGCDVFLGLIRNRMDKESGKVDAGQIVAKWPIPTETPSFSVEQFSEYVAAIKALDIDASSLDGAQKEN